MAYLRRAAQIGRLDDASSVAVTDTIEVNQSGVSREATVEQLRSALNAATFVSGTYTVVADDDTAGTKAIATGLTSISNFLVQIRRSGVDVSADAIVSASAGTLTVADGASTYDLTAGDVIRYMAFE